MPWGILSNAATIFVGGILGALLGTRLPERLRTALPVVFGLCSLAIGVSQLASLHTLPAVVLALIAGTVIGELLRLEERLESLSTRLQGFMARFSGPEGKNTRFVSGFVGVLVLFCTSSNGILGAMTESLTGDGTLLYTKAVLDLFTAAIFAATLGILVAFTAIPQLAVFLGFYFLAGLIFPLTTPQLLGDFIACGGILSLGIGLRIAEIKPIRVANMLPALVLVMPLSHLWASIFS